MSEYIFGKNTVSAYLKNGTAPKKLYLFDKGNFSEIVSMAKALNVEYQFVEKHRLDKLVKGVHQGVVAEIADYKYASLDSIINGKSKLIVM